MDILLSTEILVEYFDGLFQPKKTTDSLLITKIIENDSNSFIINKELIDEYEGLLKQQFGDNIDNIYPFLEEIISNHSINVRTDTTVLSDNLYNNIEDTYLADSSLMKSIVYSNVSISKDNSLENQYSCIINEISKPNIHWLISEMASGKNNSMSVRYFDFNSDTEINALFRNLFRLSNRHTLAYIYDRQTNFTHKIFDEIKDTHLIHYYTSFSRFDRDKNQEIKSNFRRVKIFKSKNKNIHERRVIVKDLIIEADNDFWNIRVDEPTWKVDISICFQTSQELTQKNYLFRRDLK